MRLNDAKRDLYRRLAKEEGYRSRAAYKLLQIDRKYKILSNGYVVVDFGAAPGGWMQVSSEKVGRTGWVIGVDLQPLKIGLKNATTLTGDVFDPKVKEELLKLLPRKADVVLSDLSPDVSGVWQIDHLRQIDMVLRVIDLLPVILRSSGSAVFKVFEGEATRDLFKRVEDLFGEVSLSKPPASRGKSSEIFLVCRNYRVD